MTKFNLHDIENDLILSFLQSKKLWITFSEDVQSDFFQSKINSLLFKIFQKYWQKYKNLPSKNQTLTFLKKLEAKESSGLNASDLSYVENIYAREPLVDHELDFLYDEIKKFIKRNKLENALYQSATEITDEEKYEEIEKRIKEAIFWKDEVDVGNLVNKNITERYNELQSIYENVIKTPWSQLNAGLGGGLFAKEIACFIAASGVGKSVALSNLATHAYLKLKKNVAYITLEMSSARICQRMDVSITKLKMSDIIKKQDVVKAKWEELTVGNNANLYVKEFPTSTISAANIEKYFHTLKLYEGWSPDLIVVDYADILLPRSKSKDASTYITGGAVMEELRGLTFLYNCPLVTATQTNRGGYNIDINDFNESHVGESMKKLFTLDTLIVINSTDSQRMARQGDMKILKTRNGVKGQIIPINITYEHFLIEEQ